MKGIVLHFDFGYSYRSNADVRTLILDRLPATIWLVTGAAILWLAMGIPVGIISAIKRRSLLDRTTMVTSLAFISAPVFWLGLVALYLFAQDVGVIQIFPGIGSYADASSFTREVRVDAAAVDRARRRLGGDLRPLPALEHDRRDVRGLHPHRPRQGPARARG